MKEITAVIMAGGKSSRMKRNKALLEVSGEKMIEKIARALEGRFKEIMISTQSKETYAFLPYRTVTDDIPDQGPLMGILCALKASNTDINFVTACDIPEADMAFVESMMAFAGDYDVVVPVSKGDKFEPLFAFYHKSAIPEIEKMLTEGDRKTSNLMLRAHVKQIPMENNPWYHNLNTDGDYRSYLEKKKT